MMRTLGFGAFQSHHAAFRFLERLTFLSDSAESPSTSRLERAYVETLLLSLGLR